MLVPAEKLQATATSTMSFLQRYSAEQGIKLPSFGMPLMLGISPGSAYMEPELAWGRSVTVSLQWLLEPTRMEQGKPACRALPCACCGSSALPRC